MLCELSSSGVERDASTQGPGAGDASETPGGHHRAAVPATAGSARHTTGPPREAARLRVGQSAGLQ